MTTRKPTSEQRPWDDTFRRNKKAAEERGTDVNDELEKEWPGGRQWVERFVYPFLPANGIALEIGPGTGRIARWVLPKVSTLHLVDYSSEAIETLRTRFPTANSIHIEHCRFPEVTDNSVDLVYSIGVFGHLFEEQVYTFLLESVRVLKPGGHIALHCIDMAGDFDHFVKAIPVKVDKYRNIFRYLHPDYATMMAGQSGLQNPKTENFNRRHYFLTASKP